MQKNMEKTLPKVKNEIKEALLWLARKYIERLELNSPVDTGLLEDSWIFDWEVSGDNYKLMFWNTAKSKNGELYMEWVNDGHDIKVGGVTVGWVEGQFFLEATEHEIMENLPNWKANVEQRIAQLFLNV